jgi:Family of unknown function (DUF5701)
MATHARASNNIIEVFEQQLETLTSKGYPELLKLSEKTFRKRLEPLKEKLDGVPFSEVNLEAGKLPFVIVLNVDSVNAEEAMTRLDFKGKAGVVSMYPRKPEDFKTIEQVSIPDSFAYLLTDIDRGKAFLNVTPESALKTILEQNRSPLTINEGIAVLTQYPDFLMKNNCFSLLASRFSDQRVPALWISEKKPKLGWCWDRNPHTWLGSASCGARVSF